MNNKQIFLSDNQTAPFQKNSSALLSSLDADEIDFEHLLALISEREALVKERLKTINLDEKQQFVADELKTNEDLKKIVGALKAEQQSLLVNFLRSRKAIKKYNK